MLEKINHEMAVIGCVQLCTHNCVLLGSGGGGGQWWRRGNTVLYMKFTFAAWRNRRKWLANKTNPYNHAPIHPRNITHSLIHSVDEEFFFLLSRFTFSFYSRKSLPHYHLSRLIYARRAVRVSTVIVNSSPRYAKWEWDTRASWWMMIPNATTYAPAHALCIRTGEHESE